MATEFQKVKSIEQKLDLANKLSLLIVANMLPKRSRAMAILQRLSAS